MPLKDIVVKDDSNTNKTYNKKHPYINKQYVNDECIVAIYDLCISCNRMSFINPITKLCLECALKGLKGGEENEKNEPKISK